MKERKIAIVYDWIDKWGGAERVLLTLHDLFPQAAFYTSYVDLKTAPWAKDLGLKTSFINSLPPFIKKSRIFSLPFYAYAFESFDFSNYDIVISVTSSFAKGIITKPPTKHICYLLTPTRFLWTYPDEYQQDKFSRVATACFIKKLREWDFVTAQRPDFYAAISQGVADRCLKFYRKEARVIYPPFDIDHWEQSEKKPDFSPSNVQCLEGKKYFLVVSRLEKYKRIDLAIDAFNNLGENLVVVGRGTEEKRIKRKARNNIIFINAVNDQELAELYKKAEALIMPQEEDFGYVSLEAQFYGCPVVAYGKGGAVETLINGKTGIYFYEQQSQSLRNAVERLRSMSYNIKHSTKILGRKQAEKFNKERFKEEFVKLINRN